MVNVVYTIGYSGFSLNEFIQALTTHKIALVIDVRSYPYSSHFPDFNKDTIEKVLKNNNIYYRNYANEFGARQKDPKYYSKNGYLDFALFAKSEPFLRGVKKLCKSMEQNYTFVLMCAEKDPINCHRTILVARAFYNRGYEIVHLLPNNNTMTQQDIERRLLQRYFPNKDQVTLFNSNISSDNDMIDEAYVLRNSEIGYKLEEEY